MDRYREEPVTSLVTPLKKKNGEKTIRSFPELVALANIHLALISLVHAVS